MFFCFKNENRLGLLPIIYSALKMCFSPTLFQKPVIYLDYFFGGFSVNFMKWHKMLFFMEKAAFRLVFGFLQLYKFFVKLTIVLMINYTGER